MVGLDAAARHGAAGFDGGDDVLVVQRGDGQPPGLVQRGARAPIFANQISSKC